MVLIVLIVAAEVARSRRLAPRSLQAFGSLSRHSPLELWFRE
jgi:hypothetical protein